MTPKKKEESEGKDKTFYITTTLPYVNAPLHLGHATEIIRADTVARYQKLAGRDVFFNTGTDEHGMKIYETAQKAGKNVQQYVDEFATLYKTTLEKFSVSTEAHFIRTTDPHHIEAAQEFWKRCDKDGYIYKKNYQAKYCISCEEVKTDSELVNGKCPTHDRVPELINEENYFFKLSEFKDKLLSFYDTNPDFIIPRYRMNELREFIKGGLKDFSISRLKSKMPWGIAVPGDFEQVMYVWFDALVNYISTLGWPEENRGFKKFWIEGTPTQYCGKDNIRFQGLMWQAMLMAAGLSQTHTVVVDGWIVGDGGLKMSKTLGNTIDPLEIVKEYGTDALRYFILREFHPFEDTAVSKEKLKEWYNANLANGLGNLVSRVMKMAEANLEKPVAIPEWEDMSQYFSLLESFDLKRAGDYIWTAIADLDRMIQDSQPFKLIKSDREKGLKIIAELVIKLYSIARMLDPILPETSDKIKDLIRNNKVPDAPLFPRKD